MFVVLLLAARRLRPRRASGLATVSPTRLDATRLRRLWRLGLPAATQISLEVGVFAAATALAGRLDPVSSAAHQIALNIAAIAFMVPLGISSAGAVRVGHARGRAAIRRGAARAGWTALRSAALHDRRRPSLFVAMPRTLIGLFTTDPAVLALGASLLCVAAVFQLFDGLQVVATGVLRGLGDTRTPCWPTSSAHWLLGLPVGYALCFSLGMGVVGLWIGLSHRSHRLRVGAAPG